MPQTKTLNEDHWIRLYKECGALWIHDGNPKRPHALLTSGKHSSGFFNSGLVTEVPSLLNAACDRLVVMFEETMGGVNDVIMKGDYIRLIERVVGPAMGAITIAHCIATSINKLYDGSCRCAFTEKDDKGGDKRMILKRTALRHGETVLAVEDVLTTGGSVELTVNAVSEAGGETLPYILVLVNRSGLKEVGGKQIVALIDKPMPMWTPEECPLCKEGSQAIRPKGVENWAALNADY